jgi:hypothetical protein
MINKFPFPMQNRDFVEMRHYRQLKNEARMVYYSVDPDPDEDTN